MSKIIYVLISYKFLTLAKALAALRNPAEYKEKIIRLGDVKNELAILKKKTAILQKKAEQKMEQGMQMFKSDAIIDLVRKFAKVYKSDILNDSSTKNLVLFAKSLKEKQPII